MVVRRRILEELRGSKNSMYRAPEVNTLVSSALVARPVDLT